jgi:phenylacetate-CoA ligase
MTLAGRIRARVYAKRIADRSAAYAGPWSEEERSRWQLERLNREWQRTLAGVPYYRELRNREGLPAEFDSLDQFVERVPSTRREDVQSQLKTRTQRAPAPDFQRVTGGSTSKPVQIPAWYSEVRSTQPDMWVGRGWYGIDPASRLFTIWGHSHLLGTGLRGWINARQREGLDALVGYRRFSAYDLRPEAMRSAVEALLRFKPDYLLGYSVALDRFAVVNADLRDRLRGLQLRAVVGTAESFPDTESVRRLGELFDCPVAMEYGAVETGLLAHTHVGGGYRAFWRSYLLEAQRGDDGGYLLRVTSLFPRCFPLVRYEIGDEIEPDDPAVAHLVGLTRFRRVIGRCNDYVELADGARIHSEVFSHAVRPCAEIRGFQVVTGGKRLRIRFVADVPLSDAAADGILGRLRTVHDQLGHAELVRVESLTQTVAGKTRMIVPEETSSDESNRS